MARKKILTEKHAFPRGLDRTARLLALAGDETRIRILHLMLNQKEACVTDVARGLNMSLACVSHHLQLLKDAGLVKTTRKGNNICYALNKNSATETLKKILA